MSRLFRNKQNLANISSGSNKEHTIIFLMLLLMWWVDSDGHISFFIEILDDLSMCDDKNWILTTIFTRYSLNSKIRCANLSPRENCKNCCANLKRANLCPARKIVRANLNPTKVPPPPLYGGKALHTSIIGQMQKCSLVPYR